MYRLQKSIIISTETLRLTYKTNTYLYFTLLGTQRQHSKHTNENEDYQQVTLTNGAETRGGGVKNGSFTLTMNCCVRSRAPEKWDHGSKNNYPFIIRLCYSARSTSQQTWAEGTGTPVVTRNQSPRSRCACEHTENRTNPIDTSRCFWRLRSVASSAGLPGGVVKLLKGSLRFSWSPSLIYRTWMMIWAERGRASESWVARGAGTGSSGVDETMSALLISSDASNALLSKALL